MSTVPRLRSRPGRVAAALVATASAAASAPTAGVPPAPVPVRVAALAGPAGPCRGSAPADFDGDGASDLAAGAPYADVGGQVRAGAVAVRAASGVSLLSEGGASRPGEGFGAALASGDFDRDGCADLAVGIPDRVFGARRPGAEGAGAVRIYLGSRSGLRPGPLLTARSLRRPHGTDRFGASLAAADLDGDRDDELAVGAPGLRGGGGVAVFGLRGRALRPGPLVTQRTPWVGQSAAETDGFGGVLAAGDFDGDGRAEIAAGAPDDGARGAGTVTVLDPLERSADYVSQDEPAVAGTPERADGFGSALAAADLDGDGHDELAVGAPGEDREGSADLASGAVQILAGPGMAQVGPTRYGRGDHDRLGSALAAGDLDGDGSADLAAGAPGAGTVLLLRGRRLRARTLTAPLAPYSRFGGALTVRGGTLVVGAPGADGFGGAVFELTGTPARPARIPLAARGLTGYSLG
ncbi:FG-GAP repeat protein [Actinomadura litoris]|uniref:FG-GAP repeat protein n=1 Tax=Actinomadura litoris TaxID=2678616 RepID=UPI001FA7E746|nr:FG-GAP repeat protein [Actinomadura litoris]